MQGFTNLGGLNKNLTEKIDEIYERVVVEGLGVEELFKGTTPQLQGNYKFNKSFKRVIVSATAQHSSTPRLDLTFNNCLVTYRERLQSSNTTVLTEIVILDGITADSSINYNMYYNNTFIVLGMY